MSRSTPELRIGLIGTGFMGKAHAYGFTMAPKIFELPFALTLKTVADVTGEAAASAARQLGFTHATTDWREIVADSEIDIVSITAPNALHKEMSLAAIAAGKHVYCEKPLAPLAADALEMAAAAEAAWVKTQGGFNYLCNPVIGLACEMIASSELGEIRGYRGIHAEDYMADAGAPWTFRHDPAGRQGFRRIEAGAEHPPFGRVCPAAGHQLGFNDLKAIEVDGYVDAIAGRGEEPFNFRKGLGIQTLVEPIRTSSAERAWGSV